MGGPSSIAFTLLLFSVAMVFIGVAWLAIRIRKFRSAARRRQDAWVNLSQELSLDAIKRAEKGTGEGTGNQEKAEDRPLHPTGKPSE